MALETWEIALYGCGCDGGLKPRKWRIQAENKASAKKVADDTKDNLISKGFAYRKVRLRQIT